MGINRIVISMEWAAVRNPYVLLTGLPARSQAFATPMSTSAFRTSGLAAIRWIRSDSPTVTHSLAALPNP